MWIGLISDIHDNLFAPEAALAELAAENGWTTSCALALSRRAGQNLAASSLACAKTDVAADYRVPV